MRKLDGQKGKREGCVSQAMGGAQEPGIRVSRASPSFNLGIPLIGCENQMFKNPNENNQ